MLHLLLLADTSRQGHILQTHKNSFFKRSQDIWLNVFMAQYKSPDISEETSYKTALHIGDRRINVMHKIFQMSRRDFKSQNRLSLNVKKCHITPWHLYCIVVFELEDN